MNCWHCNTKLIWGGDHDIEDENDDYCIVSNLSCPECKSFVEVYLPKGNFKSFCTRMWLDHCDENAAFGAVKLTQEEYIKKYNKWLLEKYAENMENT